MTLTAKEQIFYAQIRYDYETSNESIRNLARRFNVHYQKLTRLAKKENWQKMAKLNHFNELNVLQEVEKRINNEFNLPNNIKLTSTEVINNAFNIIDKLHSVHNKSLTAIEIIIDDTLDKLKKNLIDYVEAVNILQKIGGGLDKISSFYKEPAMTNVQINNNKKDDEFSQIQFYIPEKSS